MGSIPIATLFIGIFVLLQIPLTILVGYRRARTGILLTRASVATIISPERKISWPNSRHRR